MSSSERAAPTVLYAMHDSAVNGAGLAVMRCVEHVAALGWQTAFWLPGPGPGVESAKAVSPLVWARGRPIRYSLRGLTEAPGPLPRLRATPAYLRDFTRILDGLRPDVLHANTLFTLPEAACARRLGIPVVVHAHEILRGRAKDRAILRWTAGVADRVIAVSEACAEPLRAAGLGDRVEVVTNGIDGIAPLPYRTNGGPVVGTVGTLSHRKGTDLFLDMAERVSARRPDARFVILGPDGDGPDVPFAAEIRRRAAALAPRVDVRIAQVSDVVAELGEWSAFTLPARQDPFPLAVLEAMAAARPVVASSVGGVPEQVEDGVSGVLVPPERPDALAAAVLGLLDDPDGARRMGERAAARARERFGLERQGARLAGIYDDVRCARGASPRVA